MGLRRKKGIVRREGKPSNINDEGEEEEDWVPRVIMDDSVLWLAIYGENGGPSKLPLWPKLIGFLEYVPNFE